MKRLFLHVVIITAAAILGNAKAAEFDAKAARIVLSPADRGVLVNAPEKVEFTKISVPAGETIENIYYGDSKCNAPWCRISVTILTDKAPQSYVLLVSAKRGTFGFTIDK